MKLNAKKRPVERKAQVKEMRRSGNIPAVCYAPGKQGDCIEIDGPEFHSALRKIKPG
ncbi:MAG: 50S ribosomal protein L25, partial [Chlamydiae bacterium]|nr:50S ribosomal protein L25 [Chlamydiota bacterium]